MSLLKLVSRKTYQQGFQPGQTPPHTSILSVIEVRLKISNQVNNNLAAKYKGGDQFVW